MVLLKRYLTHPLRWVVVWVFMVASVTLNAANSFTRVVLKHRDAADIQEAIAPLLASGSAIAADNRSVIIRAPSAEIKSLVSTIKKMDKPRKPLLVSVFRGPFPDKKGVKSFSTHAGVNHTQTVSIEEGQTLVVTEKRIVSLVAEKSTYASNNLEDSSTSSAPLSDRSAVSIIQEDGQLAVGSDDDSDTNLGALSLEGNNETARGEVLQRQRNEFIDVPTGLHLRVTLVGKKKARVRAKVVSAASANSAASNEGDASHQVIALSNSLETMATFATNTWFKLSEANTQGHRPALNQSRKVYSTRGKVDDEHSVWLKVETP